MELSNGIHWSVDSSISVESQETIRNASDWFLEWISPLDPHDEKILKLMRSIQWKPSSAIWRRIGFHHVELSTVFIDPHSFPLETALHELAHILDNRLGPHPLASIFGGGPSDDMLRFIGMEPDQFFPRFSVHGYEKVLVGMGIELNPTTYGRSQGPAEDFAESFRLAILQPEILVKQAPRRSAWFKEWKKAGFRLEPVP
jgi:hypothetical protein